MPNEKTVQATNFTCYHAGPMEGWAQFRLEPPNAPVPMQKRHPLAGLHYIQRHLHARRSE